MTTLGGIKMYKQIVDLEECETLINIDYFAKTYNVYTTRASVMNRLSKVGYQLEELRDIDNNIYACKLTLPTNEIGKLLRTSIFKY